MEKYTYEHICDVITESEKQLSELYIRNVKEETKGKNSIGEIVGSVFALTNVYMESIVAKALYTLLNE